MFELDYWIEEIVTKKWALVSSNLDERVKSYGYLKKTGPSCFTEEKITTTKRILGLMYKYRD